MSGSTGATPSRRAPPSPTSCIGVSAIPAIESFDPAIRNLRRSAISGVVATGIAQAVRMGSQFGSVIVLSRLLGPADFGVLAMAGPVVAFASLFQDLGLTQAVIQSRKLTQELVSNLFFVSVATGLCLASLLWAVAPWVGAFYGDDQVRTLTAALGLNVVLWSLGSLHFALLSRTMRFGTLAAIDSVAAVAGFLTSLAFAFLLRDFWALYLGGVVAALVPALGYWLASAWRPSLPRRGTRVGQALRFGSGVTGFNVANFFSRNADNVLVGKFWGDQSLGLYDRAYKLLLFPLQQINGPLAKVMLPLLSHIADDPPRYRSVFLRTQAQILLVTLPGIAFMVGTADQTVPLLMGPQWAGASDIFAVLGLAGFVQVLNNPTGWLFLSQGRTTEYMIWGLFASFTNVLGFVVGLRFGPMGVAAAYAASEILRTPLAWWYVTRRGPVRIGHVLGSILPHYAGVVASLLGIGVVRSVSDNASLPVLGLALLVSYATTVCVLTCFRNGRSTIEQTIGTVIKRTARPEPS